jgi:hypothetical protein
MICSCTNVVLLYAVSVLHWFGHRAQCVNAAIPSYRGERALVCAQCMLDFVPQCAICKCPAMALGVSDGFAHYEFWYLCPTCMAQVQAAGHWKIRRAQANQARVDALMERFPQLSVTETAPRRIVVGGEIAERSVRITLKIAARQGESERYVFRVSLRSARKTVERSELAMDEDLIARLVFGSPTISIERIRWLRLGFLHLGKLDVLRVLEGMINTAEKFDRPIDVAVCAIPNGKILALR